ncbi:hypothetical protein DDB_G0276813 [Dictyostelium discoideum AX4]|uniref:SWIM-type domain-containing protein n=1 Tax=Dictyostelium discoideum TaxID=44689 RepID=Q7KWL2_DICDI|nr:hypothetical protein DDB_G0276813 [Dictyostelium discoideum AX4]EAL68908.1 hypothetical protein DDB_G0276813 [Dictyostelium discoideum AX4]|eukprot:XP_642902.1 hypothetical protein DDB_G0276813 [Dictyostelium discoideum AX4]
MKTLKDLTLNEAKNMGPDRSHLGATLKYVGPTLCVARVLGASTGGYYKITIKLENGKAIPSCTCPMGGGCKHCRSVAIMMVQHWQSNPKLTFTSEQLFKETLLFSKTKSQLIDIIVRMKKKNPDLYINNSDDFDLYQEDDDDEDEDDEEDEDEDDEDSDDYDDHEDEPEYDRGGNDYRDRLLREEDNMYKKRKL